MLVETDSKFVTGWLLLHRGLKVTYKYLFYIWCISNVPHEKVHVTLLHSQRIYFKNFLCTCTLHTYQTYISISVINFIINNSGLRWNMLHIYFSLIFICIMQWFGTIFYLVHLDGFQCQVWKMIICWNVWMLFRIQKWDDGLQNRDVITDLSAIINNLTLPILTKENEIELL
jgi:hypothetical protein